MNTPEAFELAVALIVALSDVDFPGCEPATMVRSGPRAVDVVAVSTGVASFARRGRVAGSRVRVPSELASSAGVAAVIAGQLAIADAHVAIAGVTQRMVSRLTSPPNVSQTCASPSLLRTP